MPTLPAFADRAFTPQNGLEQNEPEHAVDVQKDKEQNDRENDNCGDQAGELRDAGGVDVGKGWGYKLVATFRPVRGELTEVTETTSADVQFPRQNCDQRQARPLPKAETSEELFARVLQGGLDGIDGGEGQ